MPAFLEEIVQQIQQEHESISNLIIVLPSKRAGGFFKYYLRQHLKKATFSPKVISIEEFIEQLSGLTIVSGDSLLVNSYEAYLATNEILKKDEFPLFTTWANSLLNDFSEMDRYLINPTSFFSYLGGIKSLEKWGVQNEETTLIKNYLSFWNNLMPFYENLTYLLSKEQKGYQGMVYRKAAEDIEHYIANEGDKPHYFVGFNALNTSEQHIIQALLETGNTKVCWDMDTYFYKDKTHTASHFLRSYMESWKYYQQHPLPSFPNNYGNAKNIKIVSAQNTIEEVKYAGNYLANLTEDSLNKTAVVLADETLLIPLLYSLPPAVSKVNVTMGLPLKSTPVAAFFTMLLKLHSKGNTTYYHKDVLALLNHPICRYLITDIESIIRTIVKGNYSYIGMDMLNEFGNGQSALKLIFGNWKSLTQEALENTSQLLNILSAQSNAHVVERLCFDKLQEIFHQIAKLQREHTYLKNIDTLEQLFSELLSNMTLDFEGDAYDGLQIMGVLETRVLDFENILMLSVNEGVLPAGKSSASFITYDLKKQFGLPLYTDKDSVYTYHFYRLLQRAQSVTMVYSSFTQGLSSGEKSRFITQMEMDAIPTHEFAFETISTPISLEKPSARSIKKTQKVMERLASIANKYFSPSALTLYVRNPIDFYYQKVLSINEHEAVEETVALNTLGTIVHNALEELYKPFIGTFLTADSLKGSKVRIDELVVAEFHKEFKEGDFERGKNLIIFEVAKRYVNNIVDLDISEIEKGNTIKILHLENQLKTGITIPSLEFPVFIGGMVDRIDEYNGVVRIIDYKTGMVQQRELEILNWEDVIEDYGYSKAFQVLAYAYVIQQELGIKSLEAGVISLKNLTGGFLKFAKRDKVRGGTKESLITPQLLANFKTQLDTLIGEICDSKHPFMDNLDKK
ncbi:MAG: PD-(D/E)XK nuclease family protein [Aureisphaera sp.]